MTARRRLAGMAAGLLLVVSGGALTGCGSATSDRPVVVVSTTILGDVVGAVVGDRAEVLTLMPPGSDPHSFEISPQEAARLRDADLVVSSGLGLEEGVQQHLDAAVGEGVPTFVAGDHVQVLPYVADDGAPDDGAPGDEPADEIGDEVVGGTPAGGAPTVPDPHWWTDPRQMDAVVAALEPALAAALPQLDRTASSTAAADYRARLAQLDGDLAAGFAAVPPARRGLVTNHHVFGYLAHRYGFRVIGTVLPSGTALAAPSASDLDALVTDLETAGVRTIFADVAQPERLMQVLAQEADVQITVVSLYTESLGPPGGEAGTYLDMMRTNADLIRRGLTS